MELTEEHRTHIEELLESGSCPREGACYKSDFEEMPKGKLMSSGEVVQCLEEDARQCPRGLAFGSSLTFCKCPVRKYVAKHFKR